MIGIITIAMRAMYAMDGMIVNAIVIPVIIIIIIIIINHRRHHNGHYHERDNDQRLPAEPPTARPSGL
jgi:uncharacterized membrane protein YkvI